MFKVPEWGTDVPDSSVNFAKTSTKKTKNKNIQTAQGLQVKPQVNGSIQKQQTPKKSTDKRKLKKIRQKNRELYQKLSNTQSQEPVQNSNSYQPGRFVLNPNKNELENKKPEKTLNANKVAVRSNKHENIKKPKLNKSQKLNNRQVVNTTNNTNGIDNKITKKRKHVLNEFDSIEFGTVDTNKADEIIIHAKKKKLDDAFKEEDREDVLFGETTVEKSHVRFNPKKARIKQLLDINSKRNSINVTGNSSSLRERMLARLQAAQFRYINEKLYTSTGNEAKQLFQSDPAAFETYHQGYQQQVKKWPVNPLDVIVKRIMKMPKSHVIADMGCGSASLARRVSHSVRSFDLVASAPGVTACDMARTPLLAASVDAVVYCLALMGTQLTDYLTEGNRVLKIGGHLLIAEVESRFDKLDDFTHGVERLGFKLVKVDQSHKVFYFLEFKKTQETPKKARNVALTLKPCLYKRR